MNKKLLIVIGAFLVVALLAGGAFMAMRLLNTKSPDSIANGGGGPGGNTMHIQSQGGPGGNVSVSIQINPSPLLPKQTPDLRGMVTQVKDNSIFIAQMDKMMGGVINGKAVQQPTPAGPYTEVVISKDTKLYRDVTMDAMPDPSQMKNGGKVDQKLEEVDASAIVTGNSNVQVWGQKRGDRLIADVIVVFGLAVKGEPSGSEK